MNKITVALAAFICSACASNPDVQIGYYLSKSQIDATVTRVVTCTTNDEVIIANDAVVTVSHQSDASAGRSFTLRELSTWYADSDVSVEHFDDGRLKGLNTTTTGQGKSIVDAGLKAMAALAAVNAIPPKDQTKICDAINGPPKDGKPVRSKSINLVYEGSFDAISGRYPIFLTPQSIPLALRLARSVQQPGDTELDTFTYHFGVVDVQLTNIQPLSSLYSSPAEVGDAVRIPMRRTAKADLFVAVGVGAAFPGELIQYDQPVTIADVGAPEFDIIVPKPKFFGKQVFELTLNGAGGITKIGYAANPGASDALGAVSSVLESQAEQTFSEKAARDKAIADSIVQANRRARCEADPDNCE